MMSKAARFSEPGNYRIEVQGQLRPDWYERFGAMRIVLPPSVADFTVTVLQGHVSDQAESCRAMSATRPNSPAS
jgi:hypothetical protein